MDPQRMRVARIRRKSSERENHLIDEYSSGRLTRREFLRRGSMLGMSISSLSFLVAACASPDSDGVTTTLAATQTTGSASRGGTLRVGTTVPARALDPLTIGDTGGTVLVGQTGEYLALSYGQPELRPMLAESWAPNEDSTIWTFKIRQGVTFSDGAPMTARDVAASFNFAADPANGTNALEAWQGILSPGGAQANDDATVVFELDKAIGSWPWLASSDNSSAVVLPEGFGGNWDQTWIGTGPWKLESYTPNVRATLVRNENYWGPKTIADSVEFTLFEDEVAMVLGLQSGDVDIVSAFGVANGQAILEDPESFRLIETPSSTHYPWFLRVNDPSSPIADKRVRQALALILDRQVVVDDLLAGYGEVGNDSPFASVHAATNPDVPQRTKDVEQARRLLAEAGFEEGFVLPVNIWNSASNPQFAQVAQDAAREIGVQLDLIVQDTATFLGSGEFGSSPQLDSLSAISDWGHRGIPNVFLLAQLRSDGVRNTSHWYNDEFDRLADEFMAESDLQVQRDLAGQIQRLLLDETPIIYPYFVSVLNATLPEIEGLIATPGSLMVLDQVTGAKV